MGKEINACTMSLLMYGWIIGSLLLCLQVIPSRASPGVDDPNPPRPTGTIVIEKVTTEDKKTLETTGRLSIIKLDEQTYIPRSIDSIRFPCGQTWESWWGQNYWYFQCRANMNCKPYRGCWCNRCTCIAFVVYPQYPPCRSALPWSIDLPLKDIDIYVSPEEASGK